MLGESLQFNEFFKFSVHDRVHFDIIFCTRLLIVTIPVVHQELRNKHFFKIALMTLLCLELQIGCLLFVIKVVSQL